MRAVRDAGWRLRRLVDATPPERDRTVDLLRAFSIGVVVIWHWALSVTHWSDGELVMPNPIDDVPLGWLVTWLLQVMPVFFLVGGFANLAGWDGARSTTAFLRGRASRLLGPTAVFVAVWFAVEIVLRVAVADYPGVLSYGLVAFVPLWFLGAYLWVVLLVPLTATAHRAAPWATLAVLAGAVVTADVLRFAADLEFAGLANTALVWVFAHQLGYVWRDGLWHRRGPTVAVAGLAGLVAVALLPVYPRSMVATATGELSHMFPTTAGIAVLAVFQLGVVLLARPVLAVFAARRRVWTVVVAVNAVIMTVFLWHMTALLLSIGLIGWLGLPVPAEPTALWWALRPLWLVVPAVILAALVTAFARAETRTG